MNRSLKYFLILFLLTLCQPALAFESKSIVKIDTSYATLYPGTFDNLVLDFSVLTATPDTLKAVSLKNLGTADLSQIRYMTLYADAGPVGFQGEGVDTYLGFMRYASPGQNWYLADLDTKITGSQRFFVSVEFFSAFLDSAGTIQMQIPKLLDNNGNGSFEVTDLGIFLDSGNNGPTDFSLTNANMQVLSLDSVDTWAPKINLSNLVNNQIINNTHYTISGIAKDQGNSGINDLKIFIDNQEYPLALVYGMDIWHYDWQNIADGSHTIKVTARDSFNNQGQSEEVTVTVANQILSLANSSVTIDRTIISNDGLDKAVVTVKLKDINQKVIANRQVDTESVDLYLPAYKVTDQNGEAIFEVRSDALGPKTLVLKTDGQVLANLNLTVKVFGLDVNSGDLIKASTPAVYYLGANGRRYVFPNQDIYFSWYSDFKNVKTLTDNQLANISIGGNVTYKPGAKLVKITSDPKVYAVDLGGTLRWLSTESLARSLYGSNWVSKIVDVSSASFMDYKQGYPINNIGDFYLAKAMAVVGINEDRGL